MKHFLIILALTSFFSATAQDSTVCISPQSARYFLEADDERWILREKDSISNELILSQSEQLLVKDQIIQSYQADSLVYQDREATFSSHLRLIREQHTTETRKLEKSRNIGIGVGTGAIIGSVIPGVGTAAGAIIGGGIGYVVSIFKTK